ncbi:MAG TPA: Uma2 family endonuclease [Thermomicrobiales bacterium]|nr:Uma2 family endonuclease [Thermomicrobiales bacterium]
MSGPRGEAIEFVPPTIHHAWIGIVSDDGTRRDRVITRQDDAAAGVAEYWIVDPRPGKESEEFLVLPGDGRDESVGPEADGWYRSRVVMGFRLRPGWLRADPLPNPLD